MPFVKTGGVFAAMKGNPEPDFNSAVTALGGGDVAEHNFTLPEGDTRTLYIIRKAAPIAKQFPRTPSAIEKIVL
jgi:16S rRNA (guanine527-N7)-methyltransferase